MAFNGGLADGWVDLHTVQFSEPRHFCGQRLARRDRKIVCGMNKEYWHIRVFNGGKKAGTQLGGRLPTSRGCSKDDRGPHTRFPFDRKQSQGSAERVSSNSDPAGIDVTTGVQEPETGA